MKMNRNTSLRSGVFQASDPSSSVAFANQVDTAKYDTDTSESMPKNWNQIQIRNPVVKTNSKLVMTTVQP
eukprot:554296-Karenia_brevis.AAC.1